LRGSIHCAPRFRTRQGPASGVVVSPSTIPPITCLVPATTVAAFIAVHFTAACAKQELEELCVGAAQTMTRAPDALCIIVILNITVIAFVVLGL
jgi:hypothetical protein